MACRLSRSISGHFVRAHNLNRDLQSGLALSQISHIRPSQYLVLCQQARGMRLYREKTVRLMYWRSRSFDKIHPKQTRRSEFQDWNYQSEIFAFSRRLQENLSEDTVRQVLAHQSYAEKMRSSQDEYNLPSIDIKSNEQLIHRGEELLETCVKPYLRYHFDRMPEDGIIECTNYLKSPTVLADMASWFGCKEIVLTSEYPPNETTMTNTVKALLAGIEMDLGQDRVQRFVVDMIISYLNDKDILDDVWHIPHPKETVNKILQNTKLPVYEPRIMFHTGIKTIEQCYIVGLYTDQKFLGSSAGETLAIAEECAALDTLQRLFDLKDHRRPFVYGEQSEKIDYATHSQEHTFIKDWKLKLD